MRNVEFKCELRDPAAAELKAVALGFERHPPIRQTDTYYRMPDGRLKKREEPGREPVWIWYHRPDRVSAKVSDYLFYTDEQARTRWGLFSLKPWLTVVKTRMLFTRDHVRVHLDRVDGLGAFFEIEAIVDDRHPLSDGDARVADLREAFAPVLGEAIAGSYADLLDARARASSR